MKNTKFKAKKNKNLLVLTILLTLIISLAVTRFILSNINENLLSLAENIVETENELIFKNAYMKKNEVGVNPDELINIIKNNKDEIVAIDFKVFECEKMLMSIIDEMNKDTIRFTKNGYTLWVPLGYMTNSPLLLNLGPKLPVKIATSDIVLGDVKTKVTDFGINNAIVEIYINIRIKLITSLPLNSEKKDLDYSALLASKIITGKVPNFYSGSLIRESETFNLPINENM